jgi:hypothetical protein
MSANALYSQDSRMASNQLIKTSPCGLKEVYVGTYLIFLQLKYAETAHVQTVIESAQYFPKDSHEEDD